MNTVLLIIDTLSQKPRVSTELDSKDVSALITTSQISEEDNFHSRYVITQNFNMIDAIKDGLVDFNELLIAIVLASRLQDVDVRLGIVFDTWDLSCNGKINQAELIHALTAIYDCSGVTD
ncbi:unnamed protein product [Rotaria magnacalcarata]